MTGCVDQEKVCAKKFSRFPNISTHLYHVSGVIYIICQIRIMQFFFTPSKQMIHQDVCDYKPIVLPN